MRKYDKEFKEEAVKLSDKVGVKQAASQLGVPYCTLAEWRQKRKGLRGLCLRRQRHPAGRAAHGMILHSDRGSQFTSTAFGRRWPNTKLSKA